MTLWQPDYDTVPGWQAIEQPTPGRVTVVSNPPGYASRWKPNGNVLRTELRPGEVFLEANGYKAPRAEVYARHAVPGTTPPEGWPDPPGTIRWYEWAELAPAGHVFATDADPWLAVAQIKGHRGGQPPFALEIKRNGWRLGGARTNAGLIPNDGNLGLVRPGHWTQFRIGVCFATDHTGWVEVWRDGVLVLPRVQLPTLDVIDGKPDPCYFKQGIYRADTWTVPHVMFHGPVTVTDGGKAPAPTPPKPPAPPKPPVVEKPWTPDALAFVARPTGPDYIRIEDIPGAGTDLRIAAAHQAADGKVITLPPGTFTLHDFAQGDGKKFMHGLMVNADVGRYHCRGIVGTGAETVIQMAPNSSHFTTATGASATEGTTQFMQNTILFHRVPDVEFGNLVLQGTEQPHFHHGFRSTGDRTHVHHLKTMGAGLGSFNMPPGETYSCAVGGVDPVIEDCEFDGRRTVGGAPVSSTVVATLAATNPVVRRCHMHDLRSGFGIVQWEGVGLTTEDVWVTRPGTGTGGWNGAHTNHEKGAGPIRHIRPHIDLDGHWGPASGRPRRNASKFPHFIFLRPDAAEDYADTQIIDPVFDQWGATKGGFAVMLDEAAAKVSKPPQVKVNGRWLTGVVRPSWWLEQPAIDTAASYWIGANSGNGSVWG